MFLSLRLPNFELQALLLEASQHPENTPLALLDSLKIPDSPKAQRHLAILHANRAAEESGVHPGMRAAHALGRCSELQLLSRSPAAEKRAQSLLLKLAESLSADTENTRPGSVVADLRHSRPFQESGLDWLAELAPGDALHPLLHHLGLASTPDLAELAARLAHRSRVPLHQIHDPTELHPLPVSHLADFLGPEDNPNELLHILSLWGVTTLGSFLALPLQDLTRRLGPAALRLHRLLRADDPRPLRLYRPATQLFLTMDLEHPVESIPALALIFRKLLHSLAARLRGQNLIASAVKLQLGFPTPHPNYHRTLRLARPGTDESRLLGLIESHLEQLRCPAPIERLRLELLPSRPTQQQEDAFHRRLRDPNKLAETLARIETLVGPDNIGLPRPADSHHPDHFHLRPWRELLHPRPSETPPESPTKLLQSLPSPPLHRFRPPIEVPVDTIPNTRPARPSEILAGPHPGPITAHLAPRRLSGNWWDPEHSWRRIEWDVRLHNGQLLRLTPTPEQWLLEGSFS